MIVRVGLENSESGQSLAYALDYPGCVGYGENGEAALTDIPRAVAAYTEWIARHNQGISWLLPGEVEAQLVETWEIYYLNDEFELDPDGEEINAWFLHDWKPLTQEDVDRGLLMLDWSREDLLGTVEGLSEEKLNRNYPGERWNIARILNHIGGSEWWYLDRLGLAFSREHVPAEPYERLSVVREAFKAALPALVGARQVVGVAGEFWSPRKMLRRALGHERDHTQHIHKLLMV